MRENKFQSIFDSGEKNSFKQTKLCSNQKINIKQEFSFSNVFLFFSICGSCLHLRLPSFGERTFRTCRLREKGFALQSHTQSFKPLYILGLSIIMHVKWISIILLKIAYFSFSFLTLFHILL